MDNARRGQGDAQAMSYTGIDYGLGRTNIDVETGIRYGVISQNSVGEAWYEEAEPQYGEPTCPKCGKEADRPDEFGDSFPHQHREISDDYTQERYQENEFVCVNCKHFFGSESAYGDEPLGYTYDRHGYVLQDCLDSDIMVIHSPYYTFGQYCSPCVPGAINLDEPMTDGIRAYCLGHDWFEDGQAPYPVYDAKTGELVTPEN